MQQGLKPLKGVSNIIAISSGKGGVGKSTIFNLITGLIQPDKGNIIIKEEKVNEFPIFVRTSRFKLNICPQIGGYFYDLTLTK